MGRRGPKLATRIVTAEKAKRAAEMRMQGITWDVIAKELNYSSTSGVCMLIRRYRQELPRQALEDLQVHLLDDLEAMQAIAMKDVDHKNHAVRDRAQRRVVNCIEKRARVSGLIKAPPPVVVMAPPREMDLSRLSIEQIEALRGIQAKLLEAPIEARGEEVHEQREERDERDERIIDVEPEGPDAA